MQGRLTKINDPDNPAGASATRWIHYSRLISGVHSGSNNEQAISYDSNGNVTTDGIRGMNIDYNHLDLPVTVAKGQDTLKYIYDAQGTRLATAINDTIINYYTGMVVYRDDKSMDYIINSTGMIRKQGQQYVRQYNITDHLGSTRAVVDQSANVIQATDYYPYGLPFQYNSLEKNRYLYNNKEIQNQSLGSVFLGTYDYGARFYDPELGRWHSVDPLADNAPGWTPYNAMWNNPILNIDPDGRWAGDYYKKDGTYLGSDGIDDDKVYTASSVAINDKGLVTSAENSQELSTTHTEFQTISAIVNHEAGTSDANENLWIAHTANNAAGQSGVSLYDKLMSGYSSAPIEVKVPLSTSANSAGANAARAGVLDVFSGGADPTGGSTLWDGTDFLAWGLNSPYGGKPHAKFRQYNNVSISGDIYNSYLSGALNKYPKGRVRYFGKYYNIPASVFSNEANWSGGNFNYNTGYKRSFGIKATGAFGHSIFWKKQ